MSFSADAVLASQTFIRQFKGLPQDHRSSIWKCLWELRKNPFPDGRTKVKLKQWKHDLWRVRCGPYRIVYRFDANGVHVIAVDRRKDIYKWDLDCLAQRSDWWGLPLSIAIAGAELEHEDDEAAYVPAGAVPGEDGAPETRHDEAVAIDDILPRRLDEAFLRQLGVPQRDIPILAACRTLDDLIDAKVPEPIRLLVFDNVVKPDYDDVADGPRLIAPLDDLRRYAEGELVTFLLKLDSEQQRFVEWRIGTGPALLKGGPGTGKTVIALYRTREVLRQLRARGIERPRILVTTYTNSLVNAAHEMLRALLREDADLVTVRTVDSLVAEILRGVGESGRSSDDGIVRDQVNKALQQLENGSAEDRMLARSIAHLPLDYLCEEIERVIIGRELDTLESFLVEERRGRRVRLTSQQRRAIWRVMEVRRELMRRRNHAPTFAENRRRAADLVRSGRGPEAYDAVIIDEAQDLDPVAIRMLVALCKPSGDLLITADGNQSIYGAGFSWRRVHEDLRFRGKTGVLRKNYRSTKEIVVAVTSYLRGAEADNETIAELNAVRRGPHPVLRRLGPSAAEADELARWLREAAKRQRVGLGCLAVLAPTNQIGHAIAQQLSDRGVTARFMSSDQVQLENGEAKVLTFHAAKGLEFPVVAVAGLYPNIGFLARQSENPEHEEEKLQLKRRVLYVAMGRAMRELCVFAPANCSSPLLQGFNEQYWLVPEVAGERSAA
ncbi:MAG TPA: UvrD-helicase domain-containing protein [Thermomicrobiales bacterium]